MRVVTLSDLHIGKWGSYGDDMLSDAEKNSGDILWLNGDIFEPDADQRVDLDKYLNQIKNMKSSYDNIVWVAGNNDLELEFLKAPVSEYAEEFGSILESFGIHLLDRDPLNIGEFSIVGNIGWSDGSLWEPSVTHSEWPNSPTDNIEATELFFRNLFKDRWTEDSLSFFKRVQSKLEEDVDSSNDKRLIMGTHYVTSKDFVLYRENPKYDYLNWYMGFPAEHLYRAGNPELAIVGHTHRAKKVTIGDTIVHNISGAKTPIVFEL
jgi:predicted phosphodiesterase